MYLFFGNRQELMACIPSAAKIVELGVFKGDNAQFLLDQFKPEQLELVDSWNSQMLIDTYNSIGRPPTGVSPPQDFSYYFGGDPTEQATMDRLHDETVARFAERDEVTIIRENTFDAADAYPDDHFDLVYIDANHQYEYVLEDLKRWEKKMAPTGYIAMNDCVSSPAGRRQNLGVLEAVTAFLKGSDYIALAITTTQFADLILTRRDNPDLGFFLYNVIKTGRCIEIPQSSLYSARICKLDDETSYFSFE